VCLSLNDVGAGGSALPNCQKSQKWRPDIKIAIFAVQAVVSGSPHSWFIAGKVL